MSFSDKQRRALRAKLSWRHVKTRASGGGTIAYVEGWHAIAEANRIFGYDCWDRATLSPRCLWSESQRGQTACFYSTKVRITVRAGACIVTREGIGTGFGRSPAPETAHEIALKAAETDATKRALATFGNPFGLALYDKDQSRVSKPPKDIAQKTELASDPPKPVGLVLKLADRQVPYSSVPAFVAATLRAVTTLPTIDEVYAFWEASLDAFGEVRRRTTDDGDDPVLAIISTLKARARALGYQRTEASQQKQSDGSSSEPAALAIPKEQRLRDRAHLEHVARQPCVICGRRPTQAHHLRFAQPRAMARKVSDEFTVPLCVGHHDSLHKTGDEQAWWARHGIIDPLKVAARLWRESRGIEAAVGGVGEDDNRAAQD
jgi:DNA recombination protein Rad52